MFKKDEEKSRKERKEGGKVRQEKKKDTSSGAEMVEIDLENELVLLTNYLEPVSPAKHRSF